MGGLLLSLWQTPRSFLRGIRIGTVTQMAVDEDHDALGNMLHVYDAESHEAQKTNVHDLDPYGQERLYP